MVAELLRYGGMRGPEESEGVEGGNRPPSTLPKILADSEQNMFQQMT